MAAAGQSAVRLVELVTATFPGFRDHAIYRCGPLPADPVSQVQPGEPQARAWPAPAGSAAYWLWLPMRSHCPEPSMHALHGWRFAALQGTPGVLLQARPDLCWGPVGGVPWRRCGVALCAPFRPTGALGLCSACLISVEHHRQYPHCCMQCSPRLCLLAGPAPSDQVGCRFPQSSVARATTNAPNPDPTTHPLTRRRPWCFL